LEVPSVNVNFTTGSVAVNWTAPFMFLLDQLDKEDATKYRLTIHNSSSDILFEACDVCDTMVDTIMLNISSNYAICHALDFTVVAYNKLGNSQPKIVQDTPLRKGELSFECNDLLIT